MKILWISDSPTSPSGFGMVTAAVCKRLAARGHPVEILGWQSRGFETRWEGIPLRPVRRNMFGADVLLGYLHRFQPDFIITLADVWWMSFLADPPIQQYLDLSGARWVLYYPLDGADPDGRLPPGWQRVLKTADVPVAMSRFGVEVSSRCGVDSAYVPHGCDLGTFAPPTDKEAAKALLGYEGKFVILSDARNQPRKLLPRTLDIVRAFASGKPNVVAHLHCDPEDDAASSELYSYQLRDDVAALGLSQIVRYTAGFRMRSAQGLPVAALAGIYAAADAHLLCSWGEGFGLPTLQAASSGVVPIAVDYSASRELVEGHGFAVPAESRVLDEFGMVRCLLSREASVDVLDALYADRQLLAERSRRSREFALSYGWDEVVRMWEEVLRAAPPRRKPVRSRSFTWVAGEARASSDLPEPVAATTMTALGRLPEGAKVSLRMSERTPGEAAAHIQADTSMKRPPIGIPVSLPPFFSGSPTARIGHILVSPHDLDLAPPLLAIFPRLAFSVPMSSGDITQASMLTIEELLPALPHYALVVNQAGPAPAQLDLACAALGVPFYGPSRFWPQVRTQTPVLAIRRLLTDPGLSEWRREVAVQRAARLIGSDTIQELRALAVANQPRPVRPAARAPQPAMADMEMFIVRPGSHAPADASDQLASFAAQHGGVVLMTSRRFLIVAMPRGGKDLLEAHSLAGFVGGITLDEDVDASRALKKIFVENALKQLKIGLQ